MANLSYSLIDLSHYKFEEPQKCLSDYLLSDLLLLSKN